MIKCTNKNCEKARFCGRFSKKPLEQEVQDFKPQMNSAGQLVCQHYIDKTKKSRIKRRF